MRASLLTHEDVHRIRTEKRSDGYWEVALGVARTTVQKARIGATWITHPTPPDTAVRVKTQHRRTGRPETQAAPQLSEGDRIRSRALASWPRVQVEM
jgi:hypothetical protein